MRPSIVRRVVCSPEKACWSRFGGVRLALPAGLRWYSPLELLVKTPQNSVSKCLGTGLGSRGSQSSAQAYARVPHGDDAPISRVPGDLGPWGWSIINDQRQNDSIRFPSPFLPLFGPLYPLTHPHSASRPLSSLPPSHFGPCLFRLVPGDPPTGRHLLWPFLFGLRLATPLPGAPLPFICCRGGRRSLFFR